MHSYRLDCNKITNIPGLVELDEQQTYRVMISFVLCRREVRAAVGTLPLFQGFQHSNMSSNWNCFGTLSINPMQIGRTTYLCLWTESLEELITHLTVPQRHKWVLKDDKRQEKGLILESSKRCNHSLFTKFIWGLGLTVYQFYCRNSNHIFPSS